MTTFTITRTFDAPRPLVFECWTNAEHMVKWFSPAGCSSEMLHSDVRPGGYNHVWMTGPDGSKWYGRYTFREISPVERVVYVNAFSDAEGNLIHHPMSPTWPLELLTTVSLKDLGDQTELTLTWVPIEAAEAELATFLDGLEGCKMGWGGTFDRLDEYLKTFAS